MKLTKCSNGHFYDGDAYSSCPHCANNMEPVNHTVSYYTPPAEAAGREAHGSGCFTAQAG